MALDLLDVAWRSHSVERRTKRGRFVILGRRVSHPGDMPIYYTCIGHSDWPPSRELETHGTCERALARANHIARGDGGWDDGRRAP